MKRTLKKFVLPFLLVVIIGQYSFSQISAEIIPPPPPPPLSPRAIEMKREVDSLSQNRELLIYKLMDDLSCICIDNEGDRIVIHINVNPNGTLDSFGIVRSNICYPNTEEKIFNCVNGTLNNKSLSLGELKVIPNALNGSHARNILYTFPIMKSSL